MLGGGVDAATLVAALGAGPPPPECRWGRRPHRGATACRLLERDDRGVEVASISIMYNVSIYLYWPFAGALLPLADVYPAYPARKYRFLLAALSSLA